MKMDGLNNNAKGQRIEGRSKGQQWYLNPIERCKGFLTLYPNKSPFSLTSLVKYIYQDKI